MRLPNPRSGVVFRELPEGAVLFCTSTETYFSLNEVGVEVWKSLPPELETRQQLVERLASRHRDVDPEVIATDVEALIKDLVANRLVDPVPS